MSGTTHRISRSVIIAAPIDQVFHFHDNTDNLLKITPPHIKVAIESRGTPGLGYEVHLRVRQFGLLTMNWHVKITEYVSPTRMVDEQISGPFASWVHQHTFEPIDAETTAVIDEVNATLHRNWFWKLVGVGMWIGLPILFAFRGWKTRRMLEQSGTKELHKVMP